MLMFAIAAVMLGALSCKKVNDIKTDEHSLYVRIAWVDQDGGQRYSKVVKVAVKE